MGSKYGEIIRDLNNHELSQSQETVLRFIENFATFYYIWDREKYENVRSLFRKGFCWHFAKILQATFNRGTVCIAFPIGHMVWLDDDNTPYDIEGINRSDCYYYIPEDYLGIEITNFKHISSEYRLPMTREEMLEIAKRYCADRGIEIDPRCVEELS